MTNTQLKVILATAKLGSISQAAKELGLSQPNASNYIKAVESEVGFEIFVRTSTGIIPSPNGMILLAEAKKILDANNAILAINDMFKPHRLRVGVTAFSAANHAFIEFCKLYPGEKNVDFQFHEMAFEDGIKELAKLSLDVFVALTFEEDSVLIKRTCDQNRLKKIFIKNLPTAIDVRKGHPLAAERSTIDIILDTDLLKQYPYVYYSQFSRGEDMSRTFKTNTLPSSGRVLIHNADSRFKLVASTDYFGAGIRQKESTLAKYGLVQIPIEHFTFNINCYVREADINKEEITQYISLFREAVNLLYID